MLANAFAGQSTCPTDDQLTTALGPSRARWDELIEALADSCDKQEWNSYSTKAGWSLRLIRGARAIVYLTPSRNAFMASFALGDKAVAAARASKLPKRTLQIIDQAKRYAEGTAVRIDVKAASDVAVIRKLAAIKLAN